MDRTLILFETKYGFTERIAKNLALILGPAKCCKVAEFNENCKQYEVLVICTPIYSEAIAPGILEFVTENANWIKNKQIFLICTCLMENNADRYLNPLYEILGQSIVSSACVKSELILSKLDNSDYDAVTHFLKKNKLPLNDYILFDENELIESALKIKHLKDNGNHLVEKHNLKQQIDEYINQHNTCVLATGYGNSIRATPIEYVHHNDSLYLLSEGGIKFANILLNSKISLCIFDPFKSWAELGGMQITGYAEIIPIGSNEYRFAIDKKGLTYEKISSLPVALNLIKINIRKIEFLWSEFAKQGYDIKQILYIDEKL